MQLHPMQPLIQDHDTATIRFKQNAIVRYLVDKHGDYDLLMRLGSKDDYTQLMQLIGYSVSGFGDLSVVDDSVKDLADRQAEQLLEGKPQEAPGFTDTTWRQGYDAGRAAAFQQVKDALRDIDDT